MVLFKQVLSAMPHTGNEALLPGGDTRQLCWKDQELQSHQALGKRRTRTFRKICNDSRSPLINKTIMSVTRKDPGHYGHISAMFTQAWHPIDRSKSTSTAKDPTQREWKHLTSQNCPSFPPESAGPHVPMRILNALSYLNILLTPKEQRNCGGDEIEDFLCNASIWKGPVSHLALLALASGQQQRQSSQWFWGIWVTWCF